MKNLTISNLEVLNIVAWYSQLSDKKQSELPMKLRFYLKKFITKISEDAKEFEVFRDQEVKNLQNKYSSDEKSHEEASPVLDNDGNPVVEDDGTNKTEMIRKVNDEFIEEYQLDVQNLNSKISELLNDKNTYEVTTYDIEKMVEGLPDDTALEFEDINILDAIFTDNGEAC